MQYKVTPTDTALANTAELLSVVQQLCLPVDYRDSNYPTVFASAMSEAMCLCYTMVSCLVRQGCSWLKWQMLLRHSVISNGTC